MPIPTPTAETRTPMTVAELRRRLQVGVVIKCSYRWYWHKSGRTEPELMEVVKPQTQSVAFRCLEAPEGSAYSWMDYPTARNGYRLWATDKGFELEVERGFINRYEWTDEGESAS